MDYQNNKYNQNSNGEQSDEQGLTSAGGAEIRNRYEEPNFTFYNGNSYQRNGENHTYQQYQSNTNNQSGRNYQSNGDYQDYTFYEETKKPKKKRERKKNGFGVKLAKCAALGLVFGLVAGGVMVGVQYAAAPVLEEGKEVNTNNTAGQLITEESDKNVASTPVSNTYMALDVSDMVEGVMPSIVAITNISETEYRSFWGASQTYESTSCGSGIIISYDENSLYIVTNNHVVDGAKTLTVTFADEATVTAEVKGTDPSMDLAVVKVPLENIENKTRDIIKMAVMGDSDKLRVGEASIAIGNALGYGQSVTMGVISALNREVSVADANSSTSYTAELIQTDAAINPGNSGGALLNAKGEVIGINSVKYSDTDVEGIGYAIPMNTAAPIIQELITKEKVSSSDSSYLGISGVDVTDNVAATYNMPTGVFVAQVLENTAAEKYGILPGDIITVFDDKKITSMDSLTSTLQYYAAGTKVEITVMRANNGTYQEVVLEVVLGRKN